MASEFLVGAETVLRRRGQPLTARQIWDEGARGGVFSDRIAGKTPWQTLKSKISVHIRVLGDQSHFVRTSPGRFYLRDLVESDESLDIFAARRWLPPTSDERVVVFPTALLDRLGRFQGVRTKGVPAYLKSILEHPELRDVPRPRAEQDDTHKQILVYILVRRGPQVLAYRRGVHNYTDAMLRGADCVGFGGHVSDSDRTLLSLDSVGIWDAARRELQEELKLPVADVTRLERGEGMKVLGLVNDDSSEVGRRHFAVVVEYAVSDDPSWDRPQRGEKSINQLRWLDPDAPPAVLDTFEYWSQLVLRSFARDLFDAVPRYRIVRRSPLRPPHLLVIAGEIGSGKTEAVKALQEELGYSAINAGNVIASLMGIPPIPETPRSAFQDAANDYISRAGGPRRFAGALLREASGVQHGKVLIDGLRQRATLDALQDATLGQVGVVYVYTPVDVAFALYRRRESPNARIEEFIERRRAPVEREVEDLLPRADAVLYNWYGRERYRRVIRLLMRDVGILDQARAGRRNDRRSVALPGGQPT